MADDKKDSKQNDFTNVNAPELKLKQSREDFDCKAKKIKLDEKKNRVTFYIHNFIYEYNFFNQRIL